MEATAEEIVKALDKVIKWAEGAEAEAVHLRKVRDELQTNLSQALKERDKVLERASEAAKEVDKANERAKGAEASAQTYRRQTLEVVRRLLCAAGLPDREGFYLPDIESELADRVAELRGRAEKAEAERDHWKGRADRSDTWCAEVSRKAHDRAEKAEVERDEAVARAEKAEEDRELARVERDSAREARDALTECLESLKAYSERLEERRRETMRRLVTAAGLDWANYNYLDIKQMERDIAAKTDNFEVFKNRAVEELTDRLVEVQKDRDEALARVKAAKEALDRRREEGVK